MRKYRPRSGASARAATAVLGSLLLSALFIEGIAGAQSETAVQVGQQAVFSLGKVGDYFNLLTSFELEDETQYVNRGFGDQDGTIYQRVLLRQAHNKDFELYYTVRAERGSGAVEQTALTTIRKAPWFYFRTINDPYFWRREASDLLMASRYVNTDQLQGYVGMLQKGARFLVARDEYLGRPVRLYRIVSSLPIDQSEAYKGPPVRSSNQGGQVWVDDASGLVLKIDTFVEWELAADPAPYHKEIHKFAITKIGDVEGIEAPKDFRDMNAGSAQMPGPIPLLQDSGK